MTAIAHNSTIIGLPGSDPHPVTPRIDRRQRSRRGNTDASSVSELRMLGGAAFTTDVPRTLVVKIERDVFCVELVTLDADASPPSDAGERHGWRILREIRDLRKTGEWRTGRLTLSTLEAAESFFRTFSATCPGHTPRISPTDAGGIIFEWERPGKELFVEVREDKLEVLRVVTETREESEDEELLPAHAQAAQQLAHWFQEA